MIEFILNNIYHINNCLLMLIWAYFYNEYLPKYTTPAKDYFRVLAALMVQVFVTFIAFQTPGTAGDNGLLRTVVGSATQIAALMVAKRAGLIKTLSATVLQLLLTAISEIVAVAITMILNGITESAWTISTYHNIFTFALMDLITLLLFHTVIAFINKKREKVYSDYTMRIFIAIILNEFLWMFLFFQRFLLRDNIQLSLSITSVLMLICSWIFLWKIVSKAADNVRAKNKVEVEKMIEMETISKLDLLDEKQSVLTDIENQMIKIAELNDERITSMRNKLAEIRNDYFSADVPANTLLNYYADLFTNSNIKFQFNISADFKGLFDSFDMNTILYNLLQNGYESCGKGEGSFIHLSVYRRSNMLMIECENSIAAKSKGRKKKIHGNGMQIINKTVQKYDGFFRFEKTLNRAISTILLTISQ